MTTIEFRQRVARIHQGIESAEGTLGGPDMFRAVLAELVAQDLDAAVAEERARTGTSPEHALREMLTVESHPFKAIAGVEGCAEGFTSPGRVCGRPAGEHTTADTDGIEPHAFVESGPGQEPATLRGCIVCPDYFKPKRHPVHTR